jgi:ribonuclease P protein component
VAENNCFRPANRLHQASEFSTTFQYRRVIRGKLFDLHWRPHNPGSTPVAGFQVARLGLVVPKRLARRAVMRNLMKRIARETFRHRLAVLPAMDLILKLARKPGGKSESEASVRPSNPDFRKELATDIEGLFSSLLRVAEKLDRSPPLSSTDSLP